MDLEVPEELTNRVMNYLRANPEVEEFFQRIQIEQNSLMVHLVDGDLDKINNGTGKIPVAAKDLMGSINFVRQLILQLQIQENTNEQA